MALYRRGTIWWVRFTASDGQRIRESTGTEDKVSAQEYHDRLKAEYWRVQKLGEKPRRRWQEAVTRWLQASAHKAIQDQDVLYLRWLHPYLGDKYLDEITCFSLATGLREANVTGLEWSQVDLSRRIAWIHLDQAKARKAIAVPLNAEVVLVLRRQVGKHPQRVFTYKGKPVQKAGGPAWRKALNRAGIEDFRWHDLRHTWASWHV